MGSCYSKPENIECHICNANVEGKYVFCDYCKTRFHYKCLMHYIPSLERCPCGHRDIRFIDLCIIDDNNSFFKKI